MQAKELTALKGCSGAHYHLGRLVHEGYLSEEDVQEGPRRCRRFTLTPEGRKLLVKANKIRKARTPSALAAKRDKGVSIEDIAASVGLCKGEVLDRIRIHNQMVV